MQRGGLIQEEMYAFFSWERHHTGIPLFNLIRNVTWHYDTYPFSPYVQPLLAYVAHLSNAEGKGSVYLL